MNWHHPLFLCTVIAAASPAWLHGFERDHHAHTHGEGEMTLIVEQETALVHVILPAINVVGFEHAPRSAEHKRAVKQAQQLLSRVDNVIALPAQANCQIVSHQVKSALIADSDHEAHAAHAHHDDHAHQPHQSEHPYNDEAATHADFELAYRFRCAQPAALTALAVPLLQHMKSLEELRVQVIRPTGQSLHHVNSTDTTIEW